MKALSKSLIASKSIFRRKLVITSLMGAVLVLSGCMSSVTTTMNASQQLTEMAVASYEKLDISDDLLADALAAQRVVASANGSSLPLIKPAPLEEANIEVASTGLRWVNDVTGSEGEISEIYEKPSGNTTCRNFKTTRLSFSGVQSYKGVSCRALSGGWTLKSFFPVV